MGQSTNDAGRQTSSAGCVCSARWAAPSWSRRGAAQLGVWLALGLIVVIVGLDLVGGRNAELLGLLVSPPILAASFVGPKRTVAVGVVALAVAIGYGRAVGVDLLAGPQGVPAVAIGVATVLSGVVARGGWSRRGGCGRSPGSPRSPSGPCWAGCPRCVGEPAPAGAVRLGQHRGVDRGGLLRGAGRPRTGCGCWSGDVRGKGPDVVRLAGVVLGSFGTPPRTA